MKRLCCLFTVLLTFFLANTCLAKSVGTLQAFKWNQRVLLVHPMTASERSDLQTQLEIYQAELEARKLQVIISWRTDLIYFPDSEVELGISEVHRRLMDSNGFILIGLDGAEKQDPTQPVFNLQNILEQIDLMPMRRAELDARRTQEQIY